MGETIELESRFFPFAESEVVGITDEDKQTGRHLEGGGARGGGGEPNVCIYIYIYIYHVYIYIYVLL